jgi:predicted AAA+ superfamily ATPase
LVCENRESDLKPGVLSLARHDLGSLRKLYLLDWVELGRKLGIDSPDVMGDYDGGWEPHAGYRFYYQKHFEELKTVFSTKSCTELAQELASFYGRIGVGQMGQFAAFKWGKGLVPIEEPDPVQLEDLVGYEYQKNTLTRNTEAFLAGRPAHHMLLFGPKGTGKSSSVKALLNRYATAKLRMIELNKDQLAEFGQVLNYLKNRGFYFIIFVDDLSFEDFEVEYKFIKSAIEGSLEVTPANVLIYVTSNRRHLIKENWSDRKYIDEEVHAAESEQEKLSLVDRFGLTLSFHTPAQEQYLEIVAALAKRRGISIEPEKLRAGALQWERTSHGRSGRTAQQYIKHLLEQKQ